MRRTQIKVTPELLRNRARRDAQHIGAAQCARKPIRQKIRHADITRLAAAHDIIQRPHGLLQRCAGIIDMHQVDIHMVSLEPAQRAPQPQRNSR